MKDLIKRIRNPQTFMNIVLTAYVSVFVFILTLYTDRYGYYQIGNAKTECFRNLTGQFEVFGIKLPWILLILVLSAVFVYKRKPDLPDVMVIAYLTGVLIAFYFCDDHELALEGYPGWNMGMLAQISFIFLYFIARAVNSRVCRRIMLAALLVPSGIAAAFAVCNNFGYYPFIQLKNLSTLTMNYSTLGNANWYCSYIVIMAAAGIFVYRESASLPLKILSGLHIVLCMMSVIFARTDASVASVLGVLFVLFIVSADTREHFQAALEITAVTFLSWRTAGFLQYYANGYNIQNSMIGTVVSRGIFPLAAAGLCILADVFLKHNRNLWPESSEQKKKAQRLILLLGAGVLTVFVLTAAFGNFKSIRKILEYLKFSDTWGNNRGMLWRITAEGLLLTAKDNPKRLLTGFGPDAYFKMIYRYFAELIDTTYGGAFLTNSHNEWLTALVNYGIPGGLAYFGIFAAGFVRSLQKKHVFYLLGILSVTAYFIHNFFCFQNILCTPFIFLVLGLSLGSEEKKETPAVL